MSNSSLSSNQIDFRGLEETACAKARGVRVESSWNELIEGAQELLQPLYLQPPKHLEDLYDSALARSFMAAARVLDAAAQWMPATDKSDRALQKQTALLAALSYATLGNFPSASAVLKRAFPTLRPTSPVQAALMALAAPTLLEEIERHGIHDKTVEQFFKSLQTFFRSGQERQAVEVAWQKCKVEGHLGNAEIAPIAEICLHQILALSSVQVLKQSGLFGEAYLARLANHVPLLMPPQRQLLQNGLLESGNATVSLPPGTGKTLLGELCLMASLQDQPGLAVFLAPYVTLGRQVARRLKKHLPPTVRVHRALAGSELSDFHPQQRAEILVATPEKLDGLLRTQPHLLKHLKIVVCDEAHLISGDARGARLEGLLTRLRLKQNAGHSLRLVLLSAALGESSSLSEWMGARVFANAWRPTTQRIALWTGDGRLTWKDETLAHAAFSLPMPWPNAHITPTDHWPAVERQTPLLHANAAFLAKNFNESLGGAVLCVCATRRGTRHMAQALSHFFSAREPQGNVAQAIDLIEKRHRVLWPLADVLRRGVAWHNASLPQDVRSLIEEALEDGELDAVAATTTLAEGADFPFRATILVDWLHWSDSGQQPLPPALFRNIAGRCGRAGAFTEGDTIIVDNPLGNCAFTAPEVRSAWQKQSFFAPLFVEVGSTFEKLGTEAPNTELLRATLASQFIACIAENEGMSSLTENFISHSYTTFLGLDLRDEMATIVRELQEGGFAESYQQGAWRPTELGHAANESELSLATCQLLVRVLQDLKTAALPQNPTYRIAFIGAELLRALGTCPEQSHVDFKNVLLSRRSRFCVKPEDFEMVLQMWLRGESPASIFRALPFAQRSSRRVGIEDWVEGEASRNEAAVGWQNELDRFVDFSRHVLEVFLPWMLRAAERLAPFAKVETLINWSQAARLVEAGVDSEWALQMLQKQAPGTRKSWAALGRHPHDFSAALKEVGGKYCDDGQDLLAAIEWLQKRSKIAA